MPLRPRRLPSFAAVLGALLLVTGCPESSTITQIVLRIEMSPDIEVPCDVEAIDVEVPGVADDRIEAYVLGTDATLPVQITLIDGPTEPFDVTIVGERAGEGAAFEQVVTLPGFVSGKSRLAVVTIDEACGAECEPKVLAAEDLTAYTPVVNTYEPTRCQTPEVCGNGIDDDGDGKTDGEDEECASDECDPECGEGLECFGGLCRTNNIVRYVASAGGAPAASACERTESVTIIEATGGTSDAVAYVDLREEAAEDAGFEFYFYGRRVYGAWVGVDGWVAFDFTPGEDPSAPTVGTGGDPNQNVNLDSSAAPPGIYPFWYGMKLRTNGPGKVCAARILGDDPDGDGELLPPVRQLQLAWDLGCFNGTSVCPAGSTGNDRIYLRVVLDAVKAGSSLSDKNGRIRIGAGGAGKSQRSDEFPELAVYGRDRAAEDGPLATIGLKDGVAPACLPHSGDIADDDASIPQRCDVFSGRCPGNTACGFTQVPDLFYERDGKKLMQPVSILEGTPPQNTGDSIVFTPAGP